LLVSCDGAAERVSLWPKHESRIELSSMIIYLGTE